MYHYKARTYNPSLGRFMQTDPIGYGDGMNMYGYVGGDPVNFVDPSGLEEDPSFPEEIIVWAKREREACGAGLVNVNGNCTPIDMLLPAIVTTPEILVCVVVARVLEGNDKLIGNQGGVAGKEVQYGTIAIIPRQWTGETKAGPATRSLSGRVSGITSQGFKFSGIGDVLDHGKLPGNYVQRQDNVMARDPGKVIIEIVGLPAGHDEKTSLVTINIDTRGTKSGEIQCPTAK
jgi:hypothetical protein